MLIETLRYSTTPESTHGLLYIDGLFQCYTLEDTKHVEKVYGETRIPDGLFDVTLRTEGGKHGQYLKRYGERHRGMLWIREVPNFEYIYIHTGNTRSHTLGCLLVGDAPNNNQIGDGFVSRSRDAYWRIYPVISGAILQGEQVRIRIRNVG